MISVKFLSKGHRWPRYQYWRRNIAENFNRQIARKLQTENRRTGDSI